MELLSKVWPQWKVVRELGEGSFGKVFEIERRDVGGTYKAALKVITIPKSKSEISDILSEGMDMNSATHYFQGMMEEIVKEFAMMEKLKGNTNIVTYEDHEVVNHEEGIGWDILIRMELLTTLTKHMTDYELAEKDVIKIGIDICKALELCQQYNIIHRDIKPENIFVSELGDYKLGDFGVARTAEKTMSGMSKKGTYTYMAPEVYKGEAYNATVDLYSLGIVLYRLVNDNRTPFLPPAPELISFSDREKAQARRMDGEELPKPSKGSKELAEIILKACAFNPKERYADATQMREALEKLLKGTGEQNTVVMEEVQKEDVLDKTVAMVDEDKTVAMLSQISMDDDKTVAMSSQMVVEEDKTVYIAPDVHNVESSGEIQKNVQKADLEQNTASNNKLSKNAGKKKIGIFAGVGALVIALVLGVILLGNSGSDVDSGKSNLLPLELCFGKNEEWAPVEGKEGRSNDGSINELRKVSKKWVMNSTDYYNITSRISIGEGTVNEVSVRQFPIMIGIYDKAYGMKGVREGEVWFQSLDRNEKSTFMRVLFAKNGNTLSIGFPYNEEDVGSFLVSNNPGEGRLYISEYQYKIELNGNELKLKLGDLEAVYLPQSD